MALSTVTLTGTLQDMVGVAIDADQSQAWLEAANTSVTDPSAALRVGSTHDITLDATGSFSLAGLPAGGMYRLRARYLPATAARVEEFTSNWFQLDANDNIANPALALVTPQTVTPDVVLQVNQLLAGTAAFDPAGIRKALSPWFAALMNVDNAPAYAMLHGDSVFAGSVSGGFTSSVRYQLQTMLRASYPVTGVAAPGIGWIPAAIVSGEPAIPVTTSGANVVTKTDQQGAGIKCLRLSNASYAEWSAQQCDRVRVWYGKRATFAGAGQVNIDGVSKGTFTSAGASTQDGFIFDTGALTAASHTLRVIGTAAAGVEAIVTAAEFFNGDYGKGVHLVDGAHYGANTSTFLAAEALTGHWQVAAAVAPQLHIVMLGLNDWGSLSVNAYLANIDSILAQIATAAGSNPYCVLLVMPYRPVKVSTPDPADFDAMRVGILARAASNIAVLDLGASWPDLVSNGGTATGVMFENVSPLHPNGPGHKLLAKILHRVIAA